MILISLSPRPAGAFTFTLLNEPTTLDPQRLSSASGNYITTLLFRGLYRWDSSSRLLPDEGECHWKTKPDLELLCEISKDALWSNRDPVTSRDYVRAFQFLIDPKNSTPQAHLLFAVKNAQSVFNGKLPPERLGIRIINDKKFSVQFDQTDYEFLYKLVHPALYPRHAKIKNEKSLDAKLISNGFFKLTQHVKNQKFVMERSALPLKIRTDVKKIEALIIDSDHTALHLFESRKIDFLRRLPAEHFSRFKTGPFFQQFSVLRFDYVGFGPELKSYPQIRKRLAGEFDPKSFQTLFKTEGKPGCPPLPSSFYSGDPCFKSSEKNLKQTEWSWPKNIKPIFGFSQMGGDDIRRAAEWFQGQWKSRLNFEVELQSREQGVYLGWLKSQPPAFFRKGLSLDRPTCLAALENFSQNHPENFIQFKNEEFEDLLKELGHKSLSDSQKKKLCSRGIQLLVEDAHIIPLGEMKFTILIDPKFEGWSLNSLNQLDLRHLKTKGQVISK